MRNNRFNQATKKKYKFNIVDVAVLVVLLAVALLAFLWIDPLEWVQSDTEMQEKTILYTVELRGIEKEHSNSIKVDDNVVFITEGIDIGRVATVSRFASSKWEVPESGDKMVLLQDATKNTVVVTIEIECSYQEGVGYFLHGQQLLVGYTMNLKFPMFDTVGECIGIEIKE